MLEAAGQTQQVNLLISIGLYSHLPSFNETQSVIFLLCFCFQETESLLTRASKPQQALGASQTSAKRWARGCSNYQ